MVGMTQMLPKVRLKPPGKHEVERVQGRVRQALDAMLWSGMDYAQAAAKVGLPIRSMRLALNRPQVKAYLNKGEDELLERERIRSIHRLADVRDKADNMPSVMASKAILTHQRSYTGGVQLQPGVVINIIPDHDVSIKAKTIPHEPVAISAGHGEDPE